MQKPIGILGGTFNPPHNGHLAMAMSAMAECNLSKVIFMPNGNPPHKDGDFIVSADHRYNMVSLAVESVDGFEISDYETGRIAPSYTIDTNRAMKELYDCPVYFIIGADSLYTLDKWRSYDKLIKECSFIVADRNCSEGSDIANVCKEHRKKGGNIIALSMPRMDITSTDLRELIKSGGDISPYVPEAVMKYIISHNLYQN